MPVHTLKNSARKMDPVKRAYLELHIAVLLFGFTAILGDLISLSAIVLVWWRVFITSISLLFLIRFGKNLKKIPARLVRQYIVIGCIVAVHWLCFFGAVKYSNASITLICMSTTSLFAAILEPLLLKKPFQWIDLGLGLIVIPAMALIVRSTELEMKMGIWIGLLSALLAAVFSIWNKKLVHEADPMEISFIELGSGWLFLSLLMPFYLSSGSHILFWPTASDLVYLLVLALLCTTLAHVLSLRSLKYISAFASTLTINLEPVYGIILAWLILKENEELNPTFYVGGLVILLTVLSYPIMTRRFRKGV
jgi:drug/metabolite transporter (DMT)-like permease